MNESATIKDERPWLAHYEPEVPRSLEIPDITLQEFFERAVADNADRAATIFFGEKLTYGQLSDQANRFAAGLQGLGVRKGDRAGIILPNCPQFMVAFFGTLKAGAVAVPLNPAGSAPELLAQLNDAGVETVVALDSAAPRVREVMPGTPVKRLIVTQMQEYLSPLLGLMFGLKELGSDAGANKEDEGLYRFPDMTKNSPAEYGRADVDPGEPALLLYTGGTTVTSKAAVLTHRNLVANACQLNAWLWDTRPEKHDIFLGVTPLFRSYGLTMVMNLAIACAGAIVLLPRFAPKDVLRAIARFRPTIFPGMPAMYSALAHHPLSSRYDLRSLRVCISGDAPLAVEVIEAFESVTGARLVEEYGMTETTSVTHCNPIYGERRAGSIGLPLPATDARIVDPGSGNMLPAGEVGELVVSGPQVMPGYWSRSEETTQVLRDGWLYTGDMARQDEDGYFYMVGRKDDIIRAGEYSIFPHEVEEALCASDKVREVLVVSEPDKHNGEILKAYVVLNPDVEATEAELRRFAAERLESYKVPARIEFRESLPRSAGKYLRRELVAEETDKGS